jgi:hypothetical protein
VVASEFFVLCTVKEEDQGHLFMVILALDCFVKRGGMHLSAFEFVCYAI